MEERDYSKMEEATVLIDYVVSRYRKGLYSLVPVSGLPGTGKSSVCHRCSEITSLALTGKNTITVTNFIDSLLGLVDFVNKADPKEVNIGIVEEMSVLFPSRRAMSGENVAIGKILDTCRKKRVILFANAPIWTSIDSHVRALANVYVETLRINKEQKVVISKVLRLQTNPSNGKTYWHWLRRNGRKVHRIFTRQPNQKVWAEYEAQKDQFMKELYDELKFKAQKKREAQLKEMGKSVKTEIVKPLTPRELKVYDMVFRKNMLQKDVAKEMCCSEPNINQIMKGIKRKIAISSKNSQNNINLGDTEPFK